MKFMDLLHRTYSFAPRLQLQCRRVRPDSDGYAPGDRFVIDDEDSGLHAELAVNGDDGLTASTVAPV